MRIFVFAFAGAALCGGSADAALQIYEPFDYLPTTEVNDGRWFGDSTQAYDTGLGLGAWSHRDIGGNGTPNGVAPVNEGDVADEGVTFTDGGGNELPVAGNAYERRIRVGQVSASAPIDAGATNGLTADNSSMWMTFLFQDFGFSGPDFGIGLHSELMIGDDNQSLEAPGFGVGFGIVATVGQDRNIQTAVYDNSVAASLTPEAAPTFNGPAASEVFFLALKVNWNEFGTPDEIFAFIIDDLTTEPDEADALASSTFDWDLATQQSLDVLNFSDTQVGYVDEIRVGSSFGDVVGSGPPVSFAITEIEYSEANETVTLTWDSREGESYAVKLTSDLADWDADLDDGIPAQPGDTTTETFDISGFLGGGRLFFRIERN